MKFPIYKKRVFFIFIITSYNCIFILIIIQHALAFYYYILAEHAAEFFLVVFTYVRLDILNTIAIACLYLDALEDNPCRNVIKQFF